MKLLNTSTEYSIQPLYMYKIGQRVIPHPPGYFIILKLRTAKGLIWAAYRITTMNY